ncbi:MAG TPA: hypothetical protein VIV08_02300 [Acidimicrobiia bacterium]
MPNTMTMYTRDLGIRALFTPSDYVPITSLEVALTRHVAPNNADLSQIVEPTDPLYERQPYGLDSAYWAPTGFGTLYSTQLVEWTMVLENTWGLIAGWVLIDPVGGQVINTGSIIRPYEASTGITPRLPPGSMVVGFSDAS